MNITWEQYLKIIELYLLNVCSSPLVEIHF